LLRITAAIVGWMGAQPPILQAILGGWATFRKRLDALLRSFNGFAKQKNTKKRRTAHFLRRF
jgi:hypothetical protein